MFRDLFRKRPLSELMAEADALFEQARYGEAKLSYDRIADRARKESVELSQKADTRAEECCDRLALARSEEALRLHRDGQHELAREELKHALETARGDAAKSLVHERLLSLEEPERAEDEQVALPLGDEELLMLVSGAWEPLQAAELERHGEPLQEALIALERGNAEQALPLLESLLAKDPNASYLWLELARAQLQLQAIAPAERSLRTFLERIAPDEGGSARLLAHRELARLAHERGARDEAIAELEAASEALSDDPRPLLDLGNYLRLIERPSEAIEVLELCVGLFPEGKVEWPVTMELGLACAAAGESARAVSVLEGMLQELLAKGHLDLPPPAALALAKLHEQQGNLGRAADLYRTLAQHAEVTQRALYLREAARILTVLGLTDEAARLSERAAAHEADSRRSGGSTSG